MSPTKIMIWVMTGTGGAVGLFAPVGVVKWLLQSEPEEAGILTFFVLESALEDCRGWARAGQPVSVSVMR